MASRTCFVQTFHRSFATQVSTDKISRGGSADAHFFGVTDTEGRTLSLDGLKTFELRCVYDTEAVAPGVDVASAMGQDLRSEMCEVMCGPLAFPPSLVHILTAQCHAHSPLPACGAIVACRWKGHAMHPVCCMPIARGTADDVLWAAHPLPRLSTGAALGHACATERQEQEECHADGLRNAASLVMPPAL